jgi:hypothetical protein|tara:strand:- start:7678 stop:8529 length:852 start_codon:yes stop_codon:yes gene_type:complete
MAHKKVIGSIRSSVTQVVTLQEDAKLNYSSPEEREIRSKYPFANVFFEFPTTGQTAIFPAYMKALQDNFAPSFAPISVFGRQDDIPVYQSTKRTLSFSLVMPAYNERHAQQILSDINTIVKNLYPSYVRTETNKTRIINSPPLIRIKFANLIADYTNPSRGLLGYINGQVNITHGLDTNGVFIIENNGEGTVYAKTYEVAFNMSVLHEETPGFDPESEGFIGSPQFPYALERDPASFTAQQSQGVANVLATAGAAVRVATAAGNLAATAVNKTVNKITKSMGE